jgi:sugar (pentulose or hexulose) kinase
MKLRWFQTHQPDFWRRVKRVMSLSDYLTFRLTGRLAGDASTAALLGLLDVPNLSWWPVALKAAGLTPEQLSAPYRTGSTIGEITAEGSALLGAPAGAKFVAGGLDHYIAALGAGVGQLALVSISLGTVLACLACSETYHPQANCILGPAKRAGEYYQLAFDENGASMLEWYRNTFAPDASFAELSEQAGNVPSSCDGLVFDNKNFHGAKPSHTPGHRARAIMESTARTAKELIALLCGNQAVGRVVATGGGAQSDVWLGILSDLCGVQFLPAPCKEAAVRGAAMLAAGA